MSAASYAEDRSLKVPAGRVVRTAYVAVERVRMGCRERMAVGDVAQAFQRLLQLGDASRWPCPNGEWDGETFVIHDGRHEFVASLMLGKSHILVAWIDGGP